MVECVTWLVESRSHMASMSPVTTKVSILAIERQFTHRAQRARRAGWQRVEYFFLVMVDESLVKNTVVSSVLGKQFENRVARSLST